MSRVNGFTQQEILGIIKLHGSQITHELATRLGVSTVAVRDQLAILEAEGLVEKIVERQAKGRPTYRYNLTTRGDETFPRHYDSELLVTYDSLNNDELYRVTRLRILARASELVPAMVGAKTLKERVERLVEQQTARGYMATSGVCDRLITITQHNCALCLFAKKHPKVACEGELEVFRHVLDADVALVESLPMGQRTCVFHIRPKKT